MFCGIVSRSKIAIAWVLLRDNALTHTIMLNYYMAYITTLMMAFVHEHVSMGFMACDKYAITGLPHKWKKKYCETLVHTYQFGNCMKTYKFEDEGEGGL